MSVRLLTGDCRAVLATLPDASVQLCVTSPPYFNLRDYGTALWDGGDAACDHLGPVKQMQAGFNERYFGSAPVETDKQSEVRHPYRDICGKCGATRIDQQIGLEPTVEAYVAELVAVFRQVRRILRDDGVLFMNLGDSYASAWPCNRRNEVGAGSLPNGKREARPPRMPNGLKEKDLIGIPWRVAFALQADGWYLRSDIIWAKPNPMPESVRDRPTKAHEYIFLLTKSARYFWDAEAVKEKTVSLDPNEPSYRPNSVSISENGRKEFSAKHEMTARSYDPSGRNIRSVWSIATAPFAQSHFATFPPALAERCIKAGTSEKGACSACGAPWVRVVSERPYPVELANSKKAHGGKGSSLGGQRHADWLAQNPRETIGWQPTCACDAPIVPCVVLDCFGGAGTASLVSERLGRDSIYIDLSPSYAEMARQRIYDDAPMFAVVT